MKAKWSTLHDLWPWRDHAALCALCNCSSVQRWLKSGSHLLEGIAHTLLGLMYGGDPRGTPESDLPLYNPIFPPCSGPHPSAHLKWLWQSLGQLSITDTSRDTSSEEALETKGSQSCPCYHTGLCFPSSDRWRLPWAIPLSLLLSGLCLQPGKENCPSRSPWLGTLKTTPTQGTLEMSLSPMHTHTIQWVHLIHSYVTINTWLPIDYPHFFIHTIFPCSRWSFLNLNELVFLNLLNGRMSGLAIFSPLGTSVPLLLALVSYWLTTVMSQESLDINSSLQLLYIFCRITFAVEVSVTGLWCWHNLLWS